MEQLVFIVTKEGRSYSTEGLAYVCNQPLENRQVNPEDIPEFMAGMILNDSKYLAKKLQTNPLSIVVVSTNQGITTINGEANLKRIVEMLLKDPDRNAWETLVDYTNEYAVVK